MVNIPLFIGFHTSQVVQDFSHQQYVYPLLATVDTWAVEKKYDFPGFFGGKENLRLCF